LALIAAALVLLAGACGVKSDEQLLEPLLGDIEVSFASTTTAGPAPSSASTTAAGPATTGDDASATGTTGDGAAASDLPPGVAPGDLGDDAALDEAADRCFDGDLDACDDLYFESPLGSGYERYGSTCGTRNVETFGGCVTRYAGQTTAEDLPPGEPPGDLGNDPALDDLAQHCFEGDMDACDQLYIGSPSGSDYESYGAACGGRTVDAGGSCRATHGAGS
jgi:hypothetical protein